MKSDADAIAIMQKLIKKHDPQWQLDFQDKRISAMLEGIVVFEILIESITAKFKLSQNRSPLDRASVCTQLLASDAYWARETGTLMQDLP